MDRLILRLYQEGVGNFKKYVEPHREAGAIFAPNDWGEDDAFESSRQNDTIYGNSSSSATT
jgi:hypothetical protein